jgi:hypothetical protein
MGMSAARITLAKGTRNHEPRTARRPSLNALCTTDSALGVNAANEEPMTSAALSEHQTTL